MPTGCIILSRARNSDLKYSSGRHHEIPLLAGKIASYTSAQDSGDLPATLTITDYTGNGTGGITHGTNVAEIVYDMAPGAELYLAKIGASLQLEQAMNEMSIGSINTLSHHTHHHWNTVSPAFHPDHPGIFSKSQRTTVKIRPFLPVFPASLESAAPGVCCSG